MAAARLRETKTVRFHFVVNADRYRAWEKLAKRVERKTSEWLRYAGNEAAVLNPMPLPVAKKSVAYSPCDKRVTIRLTTVEMAAWEAAADRDRRKLAPWIRLAAELKYQRESAKGGGAPPPPKRRRRPAAKL
jgi:TfoX/Sxy family transcriptional regulator of competence genes